MLLKPQATCYFHSAESMHEVKDNSVALLLGGGLSFHGSTPWGEYEKLYKACYCDEGSRILTEDGLLITFQTDAYAAGQYIPRNYYLHKLMQREGWQVVDTRVWLRAKSNLRQPSTTHITLWRLRGNDSRSRHQINMNSPLGWRDSVWDDRPLSAKGVPCGSNAWPMSLCHRIIETCTTQGDIVVDCFCGSGGMIATAGSNGRIGIGYELNRDLIPHLRKLGISIE